MTQAMRARVLFIVPLAVVLTWSGACGRLAAQTAAAPLTAEQLSVFAKAYVAVSQVRDAIHAELAKPGNKTAQAQQELQDRLREQVQHALHAHELSEAEYERRTYLVSVDPATRKAFDELVAQLTGQPTPGQAPPPQQQAARPAGAANDPVRVHIDHVLTSFGDTPNRAGLLPTALAEARTAAQHAALAARNTTDLKAMQQHASHVLHAVDPTVATSGPAQGYGVKRAATAIAAHIELAARTAGAPQNVATHAVHIATAARNTVQRSDRIVDVAKQIVGATSAEAAAALVNQLVPLTEQLVAGVDANADGRVTWQDGEGGLQHVEEHLNLLLRG